MVDIVPCTLNTEEYFFSRFNFLSEDDTNFCLSRVSPDLSWHAACLKCSDCQMVLDEKHTCFVREGKTFCKKDYIR